MQLEVELSVIRPRLTLIVVAAKAPVANHKRSFRVERGPLSATETGFAGAMHQGEGEHVSFSQVLDLQN
jgi:hypothetical protein